MSSFRAFKLFIELAKLQAFFEFVLKDLTVHMAPKAKAIASSSSAAAVETQMGGAPPQEASILGKNFSDGFHYYYEHEEALSS